MRHSSITHSSTLNHRFSVVIPVFRGGKAFQQCLASLREHLSPAIDVVVVVDGPDHESAREAEAFGATVIQLPQNFGPARARNVGAQAAKHEILFFIDADVSIHGSTIPAIDAAFTSQPELAALIGSYDDRPGSPNFLSQYRNLLHHYTHQQAHSAASTFWGACGAIRRSVFLAMGGFNAAYRDPCIEDIELGYRLRAAGHEIALCRYIQVKHLKHWTPKSLLKADLFYRAIPWTELIWRDRAVINDLNLNTESRLSVASVYGFSLGLISMGQWPVMGWVALLCALVLAGLNWPVYRFFWQKRGLRFALRTIPWHWLYYGYSGLGFVVGTSRYWWNRDCVVPPIKPSVPAPRRSPSPVGELVSAGPNLRR
jgi:glycosyltransferase involved in cell wall biosynthesis